MKPLFQELFEYLHHYNNKVINLFLEERFISEKAIVLLNHTINAHQIWNARIMNKPNAIGVWDIRPTTVLIVQNEENYKSSLQIIDDYSISNIIAYTSSEGKKYKNSIQDILFHIINHSTYHRGQIMADYKKEGGNPISSDYIIYKRLNL
ncbi:DinB family protein [Flavobacterium litorale]|uniref:Damage-inducible protein DinB n=1 Tax=Flavobacterium litorale TaxID=2856519 RepID=A0ABX8V5V8_9FLAO|nr:DinB family protein [Flavobacterium litorale]QYJ67877.1 damage-inducible protein DinB [Flavobacterium litorale]